MHAFKVRLKLDITNSMSPEWIANKVIHNPIVYINVRLRNIGEQYHNPIAVILLILLVSTISRRLRHLNTPQLNIVLCD